MNRTKKWGIAEVLFALSILILIVIVALPVLLIFWTSFVIDGHFNLSGIIDVIGNPDTYEALRMSLLLAAAVTVTCTFVGTLFAWLVTRTDMPFKETMKVLFTIPFMLPAFIGALAWKMLLSPRAGYINQLWMTLFETRTPLFNIYSFWGIVIIETMYLFPFVFIQVSGALERMDPTLEESARIAGAGLFTITRKITIPLILPAVVSGALLVCLYSLAHFGTHCLRLPGMGIRDRLVLAGQAAQLGHHRLGGLLERRIRQRHVGRRRRLGEGRRAREQQQGNGNRPHRAFSSSRISMGTCSARISPRCW